MTIAIALACVPVFAGVKTVTLSVPGMTCSTCPITEPVYGYKLLIEEKTDNILGAHLVGPHADEVINLFALAIRQGLTAEALRTTMFAYPTGASDVGDML